MTDMYTHQKKRRDFGKPYNFKDFKVLREIGAIPDETEKVRESLGEDIHIKKNPNNIQLSNFPVLSISAVNTKRVQTINKKVFHYEGGWPNGVDITDKTDMKKYLRKKIEKNQDNTDKFTPSVKKMIENLQHVIKK